MNKRDYYECLGVSRNSTPEEIKKAYRKMALQFHPDRNPGSREAEDRFKEAAEAYSVLIDPEKRSIYDRYGHDGLRGEGFGGFQGFNTSIFEDFEDILGNFFNFGFGDLFGGRQHRRASPRRGRDLALELEISLEEAASGTDKEIKLNRAEVCDSCLGSKMEPGTQKSTCRYCQGSGQVRFQQGFFTIARTCSQCEGRGEIINSPCKSCRGSGHIRKKGTVNLKIPAGVDDGMKLRIAGEGEAGEKGASRGDLFVQIGVKKHKFFERRENNLYCQASVSFPKAALGTAIEIPTLDGIEAVKISPGTQSGEIIRLKGKGIKDVHSHRKGDLFVEVKVNTPMNLNQKQKDLLKDLAESLGEKLEEVDRSLLDKFKDIFH